MFFNTNKVVRENDIYHFGGDSDYYKEVAKSLVKKHIDLDKVTDILMNVEKKQNKKIEKEQKKKNKSKIDVDRGNGNVTKSVGFTSQNQKYNGEVTAPVCSVDINGFDADMLEFMTMFYNKVYAPLLKKNTPTN